MPSTCMSPPPHRRTLEAPRLLDDQEAAALEEKKRQEILRYRCEREQVERARDLDRQERNHIKRARLELFEQMQVEYACAW